MNWLDGLNPEQQEAALHKKGPLLILAGAGSGKTTTLVSRTGLLISSKEVIASRMAVLTFTNKAARELKTRVAKRLGSAAEGLWAGTFHSFGLNILRSFHKKAGLERYFGIIDQSDAQAIVKELLSELRSSAKDAFDTSTLLSMLSRWREADQVKAKSDDEYEIVTEWLLPKYLKRLERLGVVDFDGLLLKPLNLLKQDDDVLTEIQSSFDQMMVDEFQDTNLTQMALIDQIVAPHKNLTVVGDDDQSIYGWRGAQVSNILNFPKRYRNCKVVRLERNYRSSPSILNLANFVISKNESRHGKKLIPSGNHNPRTPELFIFENDDFETEGIVREIRTLLNQDFRASEIAILYRSNSQGAAIEVELRKQRIPYSISGGTGFFDRKEIKDVLGYLRCSLMPNDVAFRRIINTPARGIGDSSIELITHLSRSKNISFYKCTSQWKSAGVNDKTGSQIDRLLSELKSLPGRLLGGTSPGSELINFLLEIGYKNYIESMSKDALGVQKRWALIEVFSQVMDKIILKYGKPTRESLVEFINFMELKDTEDETQKKEEIQLMTLHASKGLEFDAVILAGLDEDILPHKNLGEDIQEERRLFYVGITRARKQLILTRCKQRKRHGKLALMTPSRFITDIPEDLLQVHSLGWRPVTENQRQSMLADLFKKLEQPVSN